MLNNQIPIALTTTQEYILTQYPVSHHPESGKPMSRRQLLLLTGQLKKGKYSDAEILDWLLYFDTLEKPVTQRAACKWMCDAVIHLPEDEYKVLQAVKVAELNHVDPLRYANPMELILSFPRVRRTYKPIDPRTVKTLHFCYSDGKGLDVYDVDESRESQENMRRIINTHFGENCNPWCLLAADGEGNLCPWAKDYWEKYCGFPKRAAFLNGRLYAFSAGNCHHRRRIWWDRMDQSFGGVRWVIQPVPGDPLHRRARYQIDRFTGQCECIGGIIRGSKENGLCERYRSLEDNEPYSREFYCNGKRLMQTWKGLTYAKKKALDESSDWENGVIHIPESFKKIPDHALSYAKKLAEVYIPDTVQSLGDSVFEGCSNLQVVRLPSHLTRIPEGLFRGCSSLRSVILPASVKEIGNYAFSGCSSLSDIRFPDGLERIGNGAFQGCRSLKDIDFAPSITSVGRAAFGGCSFTEVRIPETILSIQNNVFSMCLNLTSFSVCKRWYCLFRERYGRRVRLLTNTETSTEHKCAS